ncbi:MAG: Asp-tRNA(Asn)/Glu-tRNA(Gln) amidotransferase subunit GatA [Clostridiaceae bacterium]|nr:Asp-tRNA(Asn)/Glu-tRNA(Gln) amidotransferase subunit GatA [Clostridiaceae bacterium]
MQDYTAFELGRLIAGRQISAVEATDAVLQNISDRDGRNHAYITLCAEQAADQAAAVQKRLDRGEKLAPLAGVPLAVKDNISTKGIRTTCASRMLSDYVPPYDATVIERIKDGGAVILGKTNMDEFAMGSTTETSWFGPTVNPWDPGKVPGGSSGGSAAAVADDEAWYALGSDTGGSIRQPCAYCGLTGLKPTYGAVSRYGLIAYASSLDQIGPIGRTALDCAAALSSFAGADKRDSTCMPESRNLDPAALMKTVMEPGDLKGLKIGMPAEYDNSGLQPEIRQAVHSAVKQLTSLGAEVESFHLPLVDETIPAYYLIATAEASANLARYDGVRYGYRPDESQTADLTDFYCQGRTAGFGREVRRRIMLGTFALSSGYYDAYYLKALKVRQMVQDQFSRSLERFDMLLAPVAPTTAPRLNESLADPLRMYLSDVYTVAANLAGLPALALPCGFDAAGMPIGMQLIGRAFDDARLLRTGVLYQKITDFHSRRPVRREVAG